MRIDDVEWTLDRVDPPLTGRFGAICSRYGSRGSASNRMINLDKKQIDAALTKLGKDVQTYRQLQEWLDLRNVATDEEYQRKFTRYYRVRLNRDRLRRLYELLEVSKKVAVDFGSILEKLSAVTGRLEASFSSKIAATLDPNLPVIDRMVLKNLGLKLPPRNAANRLEAVKEIHRKIMREYAAFLSGEDGEYLISRFLEAYPDTQVTHVKMLDLVLWQTRE